jgi:dinuclear metal center YbgI/SA1388 family protein
MVETSDLVIYLDDLLQSSRISDYCPNGLQVAGKTHISTLVTAVTASASVIKQAAALKADALLVHHGYFWKGESPCITGVKRERLHALLTHDINLLVYHLPLDVHPEFGNNAKFAEILNVDAAEPLSLDKINGLLYAGEYQQPPTIAEFSRQVGERLNRPLLHCKGKSTHIKTIAWCTGAGQDFLEQAANLGVDAYISGEISERTYYLAEETGVHYFAAGHHATERYGIQALGAHCAEHFSLKHTFIDTDNPV